ncbi:MAG: hypothetical protein LZ174_09535 [Thaumarchaeota archaeon]|nr:hypothetical protein [Candidatus Geocrenenecus arthurdayi]
MIPWRFKPLVSMTYTLLSYLIPILLEEIYLKGRELVKGASFIPLFITIFSIGTIILMKVDWVTGLLNLFFGMGLPYIGSYFALFSSTQQYLTVLGAMVLAYTAVLFLLFFIRSIFSMEGGRKVERGAGEKPIPLSQPIATAIPPSIQKPATQTVKPAQVLEKPRARLGLSEVGSYSKSGFNITVVGPPPFHAYQPDWVEASLEFTPSGDLRLRVLGREAVFQAARVIRRSFVARLIIDRLRSILPERDMHFLYGYRIVGSDLLRAIENAYIRGSSTVRIRRVKRVPVQFPLTVKKLKTSEYVHYKYGSAIPEELHLLLYGKAIHEALKALANSKSIPYALEVFKDTVMKDEKFGVLYGEDAVRSSERPAPPFGELYRAARRALELFTETEIYREYGSKYIAPEARAIVIGDRVAVYAQPDFKSLDDKVIYDVKTVDLESSREAFDRVREQMRVFQLAYPGSKAVVICMPYDCDRISTVELPPLTYDDVSSLLPELEKVCMEIGKEARIGGGKHAVIRYAVGEGEVRFEVWRPVKPPH